MWITVTFVGYEYMCPYTHIYIHACGHICEWGVCTCAYRPEVDIGVFFSLSPFHWLRQGLSLNLELRDSASLASQLSQKISVSAFWVWGQLLDVNVSIWRPRKPQRGQQESILINDAHSTHNSEYWLCVRHCSKVKITKVLRFYSLILNMIFLLKLLLENSETLSHNERGKHSE